MAFLNIASFKNPIPKSSKFVVGDFILKQYGTRAGKIAKVVGYRRGYYAGGDYLIQFLNDNSYMSSKQKNFRGPFKTKEIALKYQENPSSRETADDLRLKPSDLRTDFKTLPKLEKKLKEIYTKEPYKFTWLDSPVTIENGNESFTILATRRDPQIPHNSRKFVKNFLLANKGYDGFYIYRINNSLTKKLISKDYSPYQMSFPAISHWGEFKWDFDKSHLEQIENLFCVKETSYKDVEDLGENILKEFERYNRFLESKKMTPADILEIYGNLVVQDGKKILTNTSSLNRLDFVNTDIIRNYHFEKRCMFQDNQAKNLNNCPLSAPELTIYADNLEKLSSSNNPKIGVVEINKAPKLSNLEGVETLNPDKIIVGNPWSSQIESLGNLTSLKGCPSDIDLRIERSNIKNLNGLPDTLKSLDVRTELDSFDCSNTKITEYLAVLRKPKTIKGIPSAKSYNVEGYTQKQIEEEIELSKLEDEFPEIKGTFSF